MSDPNIRRWMRGLKQEKDKDSAIHNDSQKKVNPEHIWIRPKPSSKPVEELFLVANLHLDVRPAWIKSWMHLEDGLNNLASI